MFLKLYYSIDTNTRIKNVMLQYRWVIAEVAFQEKTDLSSSGNQNTKLSKILINKLK